MTDLCCSRENTNRQEEVMSYHYNEDNGMLSDDDSYAPPPPPNHPHPSESQPRNYGARVYSPEGNKFMDEYDYDDGHSRDLESKGTDPPQEIGQPYDDDDEVEYMGEGTSLEIPPTTVVQRMNVVEEVDKSGNINCLRLAAIICCLLVIAMVMLVIGFAAGLFRDTTTTTRLIDPGTNATEPITPAPVISAPTQAPVIPGPPVSPLRSSQMRGAIEALSLSADPTVFDDPNSAEAKALNWLTVQDPLQLDPSVPSQEARLQQRYALVAGLWYSSSSSWTDETGWLQDEDECSWAGITCDDGYVTILDLNDNNVQGVSEEIGLLTNLTVLDLNTNLIASPVPQSLSRLGKLEELYLYDNAFNGPFPQDLAGWDSMKVVYISGNEIQGDIGAFWAVPTLERLVVDENQFSGTLDGISAVPNMNYFTCGSNQLIGNIPAEVGSLSLLQVIWLYSNRFEGSLPGEIANLDRLVTFDAYNNTLTGGVPAFFASMPNLQVLTLSKNNLGGPIPDEFGNFPVLSSLGMEGCGLTGSINPVLAGLADTIVVLNLGDNPFDQADMPEFVYTLVGVQDLRLHNCQMTGRLLNNLIADLSNLRTLYLQGNLLGGSLPARLGLVTSLERLDLSNQFFTDEVPDDYRFLTQLTILRINDNTLGPTFPDLSLMENLVRLEMQNNNFEGGIPGSLTSVAKSNLAYIDLSGNLMTGELPNDWDNLPNLEQLRLDNARFAAGAFTGPVPDSLGTLEFLTVLQLSNNLLTGELADGFFDGTPNLQILQLQNNRLRGPIPSSLGTCFNLQFFSISGNRDTSTPSTTVSDPNQQLGGTSGAVSDSNRQAAGITGPLPASLGNLKSLEVLECYDNLINGPIPEEWGGMESLLILDVEDNLLTGPIPATLGDLSRLQRFYLRDNNFSSGWPNSLCEIETILALVPDCDVNCPADCCTSCGTN